MILDLLNKNETQEQADYHGQQIVLNKVFATPNERFSFAVYAKNQNNDIVLVRFDIDEDNAKQNREQYKCDLQKDRSTPIYWKCKAWKSFNDEQVNLAFQEIVCFDEKSKKLKSVRDGYQEYLGIEIGLEPSNKRFKFYRKPETISAIVEKLKGLPITDGHVSTDEAVPQDKIIGYLEETEILDAIGEKDSTLTLLNKAAVSEKMLYLARHGKKQFSLGYKARFIDNGDYDFEQVDIQPHHLALVEYARGGNTLTFADKANKNIGANNMSILKDGVLDTNAVKSIMDEAKTLTADDKILFLDELKKSGFLDEEKKEEEKQDEKKEPDGEQPKDEEKKEVKDEKTFTDAEFQKKAKAFADEEIKKRDAVIEKARTILDEKYTYAGKETAQIMRDVLAVTNKGTSFSDEELNIAFKVAKPMPKQDLSNFADGKTNVFNEEF